MAADHRACPRPPCLPDHRACLRKAFRVWARQTDCTRGRYHQSAKRLEHDLEAEIQLALEEYELDEQMAAGIYNLQAREASQRSMQEQELGNAWVHDALCQGLAIPDIVSHRLLEDPCYRQLLEHLPGDAPTLSMCLDGDQLLFDALLLSRKHEFYMTQL